MIAIATPPPDLADRNLQADPLSLEPALAEDGPERLIDRRGSLFRLHILETPGGQTPCVILPLDRVFEIRAAAALRLWRGLTGRLPGRDPAILPVARRNRLLLALRALDGRLEKASYRDIAENSLRDQPHARERLENLRPSRSDCAARALGPSDDAGRLSPPPALSLPRPYLTTRRSRGGDLTAPRHRHPPN